MAGFFGNFIENWAEDYKPTVMNCTYKGAAVDLKPVPLIFEPEVYYKNYILLICLAVGIIFLIAIVAFFISKKEVIK